MAKLNRITVGNFRKLRKGEITPCGADMTITGKNGAGKTTFYDAYLWNQVGKNSHDQADFDIKTTDENGQVIPQVDHSVEVEFETETGITTFRRVYRENYETKRGSTLAEFNGHKSDYYVNGVPLDTKKLYDDCVAEICDPKLLAMLSNTAYFNEAMTWQDRRKVLLSMCDDVTDADVIKADHSLKKLPAIVGARSIAEYKRIAESQVKGIAQEIKGIPARIDEATRNLVEVPKGDHRAELQLRQQRLANLQEQRAQVSAGGSIASKATRIQEINGAMIAITNRYRSQGDPVRESALTSQLSLDREIAHLRHEREDVLFEAGRKQGQANSNFADCVVLLDRWKNIKEESFVGDTVCRACGQDLPAERVEEATANFNADKASKLEKIQVDGRNSRALANLLQSDANAFNARAQELLSSIEEKDAKRKAIIIPEPSVPDATGDPEYQKLALEKSELETAIRNDRSGSTRELEEVDHLISATTEFIHEAQKAIADEDLRKRTEARIEELKTSEKTLATEHEKLSAELALIEKFARAKCSMLTDRINAFFSEVKWRLFDIQINGGIAECCECLLYNKAYSTSLSTGEKVTAGLDCINALSKHFGVIMPVFVDNAESVSRILPTAGQQIRLYHDANVSELTFETIRPDDGQGPLI